MPGPKTPKPSKPKPTTPAGPAIPATASPSTASPSAPASASTPASAFALRTLWIAYLDATPARLKLVDAFLAFLVLSGVAQFAYCVLVTSFPYNAFLAG
jgi:oligosaccharyltransferase complex subunit epsilon